MADVEANKALVRRYMQAVVDGDGDTIEALQHADVKWWVLGFGDMDRTAFSTSVRGGLIAARERRGELTRLTPQRARGAVAGGGAAAFSRPAHAHTYHNQRGDGGGGGGGGWGGQRHQCSQGPTYYPTQHYRLDQRVYDP